MIPALIAAAVGAILGALLTKLLTPDLSGEISSLRQQVAQFQQRIETLESERTSEKLDDAAWAHKFELAASQVVKIGPSQIIRHPTGDSFTPLYGVIFPDIETKTEIETFLVEREARGVSFSMRMLNAEHLRRPIVRRVIDETLACIAEFRTKHPNLAASYLPNVE